MQLPGAESAPEGAVKVAVKLPPKHGSDKFFVAFDNGGKAMFDARHYWRFDVGDHLLSSTLVSDGWSEIAVFRAYPVPYPSEERSFELEYVSKPRRIADGWLYMTKLNDEEWLHISYDLAVDYFTRGGGRPLSGSYYQVLGVDRNASPEEIKRAWRAMVRRHHPDVCHAPDAHEVILRINEAYEMLSDPEARRQYDNLGIRSNDAEVKRWPGNGFGTLTAVAEKRGETWIVRKVLGFERWKRKQTFVVPEADVGRRRIHVRAAGRHVTIGLRPESFTSVEVSFVEVARGGWNQVQGQPWVTWEEKEIEVRWEE